MFYDVPFVASPEPVVRRMLELAVLKPGELLYDLGAGDGRILFMAAKDFGARAVGVEIRPYLVKQIRERIVEEHLNGLVRVVAGSFYDVDIGDADVVTLYLLTSINERLKPKLERELRSGVRIVSHDFEIPGWIPIKVDHLKDSWTTHKIYLYRKN